MKTEETNSILDKLDELQNYFNYMDKESIEKHLLKSKEDPTEIQDACNALIELLTK